MSWIPISKAYVFIRRDVADEALPVGVLEGFDGGFRFAYAKSWLDRDSAHSLDPLNLPLGTQTFLSRKLWGAFSDAGPDNWGRKLLLATHQQAPANEIEWLLAAKGAGVGALLFSGSRHHVPPPSQAPAFHYLDTLVTEIQRLIAGDKVPNLPPEVIKAFEHGSSMGGARPKFTLATDRGEWLCKVSTALDNFSQPRAEFACLNMAADCGIQVPERQLLSVAGIDVLMVKRFCNHPLKSDQ